MNKWIIGILVVIIVIAGLAWFFRDSSFLSPLLGGSSTPVATTTPQTQFPTVSTFASSTLGTVTYPSDFTLNDAYAYDQFGPTKLIHGVSFTIPPTMATGTNLASDTRVSVEQLPRAKRCTADIFILDNVKPKNMTIGSTTYSVASTTGAAAGNRYEETVYAISGSSPCTAVRYTIHYGVIENYPAGMVQEFNRDALLMAFDKIRDSLILPSPAVQP